MVHANTVLRRDRPHVTSSHSGFGVVTYNCAYNQSAILIHTHLNYLINSIYIYDTHDFRRRRLRVYVAHVDVLAGLRQRHQLQRHEQSRLYNTYTLLEDRIDRQRGKEKLVRGLSSHTIECNIIQRCTEP